jgi:hypothetical protein
MAPLPPSNAFVLECRRGAARVFGMLCEFCMALLSPWSAFQAQRVTSLLLLPINASDTARRCRVDSCHSLAPGLHQRQLDLPLPHHRPSPCSRHLRVQRRSRYRPRLFPSNIHPHHSIELVFAASRFCSRRASRCCSSTTCSSSPWATESTATLSWPTPFSALRR